MRKFSVKYSPPMSYFKVDFCNENPSKTGTAEVEKAPESNTRPELLPEEKQDKTADLTMKKLGTFNYSKANSQIFSR